MIEVVKDKLLVQHGDWYVLLHDVYLSHKATDKYKEMETKIYWIQSPKIRLYIHVRMIAGDSIHEALNKVLTKKYITDKSYLNLWQE